MNVKDGPRAKDDPSIEAIQVKAPGHEGAAEDMRIAISASLEVMYRSMATPSLLRRALEGAISWQTRNETSVEQALRSSDIAPHWAASLLAMGSQICFEDESELDLSEYMQRSKARHAQARTLILPLNVPGRRLGEAEVGRTPADPPILSAIAALDVNKGKIQRARLALAGAWQQTVRLAKAADLLIDQPLEQERIQRVLDALEQEIKPKEDYRGSSDYRREMAQVLVRRVLEQCFAGGETQP